CVIGIAGFLGVEQLFQSFSHRGDATPQGAEGDASRLVDDVSGIRHFAVLAVYATIEFVDKDVEAKVLFITQNLGRPCLVLDRVVSGQPFSRMCLTDVNKEELDFLVALVIAIQFVQAAQRRSCEWAGCRSKGEYDVLLTLKIAELDLLTFQGAEFEIGCFL